MKKQQLKIINKDKKTYKKKTLKTNQKKQYRKQTKNTTQIQTNKQKHKAIK